MRYDDVHNTYLSEYPDTVISKISPDPITDIQAPAEVMEVDEEKVAYERAKASVSKGDVVDEQDEEPIRAIDGKVPFERIRRITGYLVGNTTKFNDAKRAEESQRVKHSMKGTM